MQTYQVFTTSADGRMATVANSAGENLVFCTHNVPPSDKNSRTPRQIGEGRSVGVRGRRTLRILVDRVRNSGVIMSLLSY
jgi:hypothetical protein